MIKAEPRSILNFLHTHFDVVRDLFQYQTEDGMITKEVYDMLIQKHGHTMNIRLREFRVVRSMGSDYEMRDVLLHLLHACHKYKLRGHLEVIQHILSH